MCSKNTSFGVLAILLWACSIGLTRSVAELLSPIGGAASIYTASSILLFFVVGLPRINRQTMGYLAIGGVMFAAYEVCISLAVGLANDRHQAMEMAIINYMWPALTVLMTTIFSAKKPKALFYPGVILAFAGVVWCISNGETLSMTAISSHIASNPLTYTLAFIGAFIWAVYCTLTQKWSNGENGITLFFMLTAVVLWSQYLLSDEPALAFSWRAAEYLLACAIVMGGGYGLWNIAILKGNMLLLAILSYFTPVLATVFSSFILSIVLAWSFWQGVAMVSVGSLICWWATREPAYSAAAEME